MPVYTPTLTATNVRTLYPQLLSYSSVNNKIKGQRAFDLAACPIELPEQLIAELGTPPTAAAEATNETPALDVLLRGPSDVISGQYEGGFKIWEGSIDLVNHLESIDFVASGLVLPQNGGPLRVLDVGCGSGNITLHLAQALAKAHPDVPVEFYLQDYNLQVLQTYTIPNVLLNVLTCEEVEEAFDENTLRTRLAPFHYMYGDWDNVREELVAAGTTFDLIVTSETIYNEDNYVKLANLFQTCLFAPTGLVYLAAKSHYFGCGGGTYAFLDYLTAENRQQQQQDGHELVVREIVDIDGPLVRNVVCLGWKCS